ncbi:MAG: peptidylprolyl isomerase [Candidatus Bathyarchaeota archaeon]|jgi:peptidyl-prolyl cis-trans isomerase A (cyclophilin A)|nr:peptidylprolyl isomerase [Candidatus Bathyarchaeota archaeon]
MKINKKTVIALFMIVMFLFTILISIGDVLEVLLRGNKRGTIEEVQETIVVIETTMGNIEVKLNAVSAPETTANFLDYVNSDFYVNTVFHRVIPGFMIQGGGFIASGKPKITEDPIELESNNGLKNLRGTIAMARTSDPNSATSQFFINLVDNEFLDYTSTNEGYAVFGEVVEGMEVMEAIGNVKTATSGLFEDWPEEDVVILGAHLKYN